MEACLLSVAENSMLKFSVSKEKSVFVESALDFFSLYGFTVSFLEVDSHYHVFHVENTSKARNGLLHIQRYIYSL